MKTNVKSQPINELDELCVKVRVLVNDKSYQNCIDYICKAMERNPHAPQPHNLLGIVLEKMGDHSAAMKHFRAAWALDPTYRPASQNLDVYGTFFSDGRCAFDESDLSPLPESHIEIIYDEKGIGHVVKKTKIEYDKYGIGHVVRS